MALREQPDKTLAWEPGTLGDPTVLSLHAGTPPTDANEADWEGYARQAWAGERFTAAARGRFANADAFEFPEPPAGKAPTHIAVRADGRIVLAGVVPARLRRSRGPLRIPAGALRLAPVPRKGDAG